MKKFLGALGGVSVGINQAFAADLAIKAPLYKAPPIAAPFNWSGCYVGATAGITRGKSDVSWVANPAGFPDPPPPGSNPGVPDPPPPGPPGGKNNGSGGGDNRGGHTSGGYDHHGKGDKSGSKDDHDKGYKSGGYDDRGGDYKSGGYDDHGKGYKTGLNDSHGSNGQSGGNDSHGSGGQSGGNGSYGSGGGTSGGNGTYGWGGTSGGSGTYGSGGTYGWGGTSGGSGTYGGGGKSGGSDSYGGGGSYGHKPGGSGKPGNGGNDPRPANDPPPAADPPADPPTVDPGFAAGLADAITSQTATSLTSTGFTGGAEVGCNWQANNWLVLGVEGDWEFAGLSGSNSGAVLVGTTINPFTESFGSRWLSTIRGRVGVANGPWLFFATGGFAFANASFSDLISFPSTGTFNAASSSGTMSGWTVGGGVEWFFMPRWSLKAEYLHVDLGTKTFTSVNSNPVAFPLATISHSHSLVEDIGRIGVNFHF
jgi:opacity protein-like surface antigen